MEDIEPQKKSTVSEHDESVMNPEKRDAMSKYGVDQETAEYANGPAIFIDPATNRRLFWKINGRILLAMTGTYFCQSLDKGTLGFSSIMGIQTDAHLTSNDYSWLGTILYIGILLGEYPTNVLIQKLPVGKYLAANVFLWGVVISCSAAATNFPALMVVRFLLGVLESCVQPIFVQMTSMWYTRQEQLMLLAFWNCMTGLQLMVGGVLAWGTSHYVGHHIYSWQLLFLVLGIATVAWAIFLAWYVPDSPMKAKCFNEDEKRLMVERVRANETGIQNKVYKKYQLLEAFSDPVIWLYVGVQVTSTLILGGLGTFSNIIIKSFGFTTLQTQLLNIAQGGVVIAVMLGSASLATKTKQTVLVMHLWTLLPIIGTAVIYSIEPTASTRVGLLIAFYCTQFIWSMGPMLFSLVSRNVAGQTKKSTTLAITFIAWSAGNAAAPQVFQASDAPRYEKGFTAHFCLYGLLNVVLLVLRWALVRRNRVKQASEASVESTDEATHEYAFMDMTDKENPNFRYVY